MYSFFLIGILIITFFLWGAWGISSEQKDGKAKLAGLKKTVAMFIITCAIGAFYYKTQQVATIKNVINIKGVKCAVDTANHPVDTLEYVIMRCAFSKARTKYQEINKITGNPGLEYNEQTFGENEGGTGFAIRFKMDTIYPVKKLIDLETYGIEEEKYKGVYHIYHYDYMCTTIQSFNPISYICLEKIMVL